MKKILVVVSIMALGLVMFSPAAPAVAPLEMEIGVAMEHASRDWENAAGAEAGESTVFALWAEPTFEVMEGLDVQLKLGMASIETERPGEPTLDGDMGFGWGFGVEYTMPMDALEIGFGFEYTALSSDFDAVTGVPAGELEIDGWTLSLFVSEDMITHVPYLGLRYSDMELGWGAAELEAADNFGIFLGTDIPMDFANINLEIGFLDETSFRVGATFAF